MEKEKYRIKTGSLPEIYPLNLHLYEVLRDFGMEEWQAKLYILAHSVIFAVSR